MADAFEENVGKLVRLGVSQIPILSLVVEAFEEFMPPGADARLREAIAEDARQQLENLQERVNRLEKQLQQHGQRLDELGSIRAVMLARVVTQTLRDMYSNDIKREALNNAAARQFDPRMGSPESRKYWLDRVVALTDLEIRVLLLLAEHETVGYDAARGSLRFGPTYEQSSHGDTRPSRGIPSKLIGAEQISLGATLEKMSGEQGTRAMPALVARSKDQQFKRPDSSGSFPAHVLTLSGNTLVQFIAPIHDTDCDIE